MSFEQVNDSFPRKVNIFLGVASLIRKKDNLFISIYITIKVSVDLFSKLGIFTMILVVLYILYLKYDHVLDMQMFSPSDLLYFVSFIFKLTVYTSYVFGDVYIFFVISSILSLGSSTPSGILKILDFVSSFFLQVVLVRV